MDAAVKPKESVHVAIEKHLSSVAGEKVRCRYVGDFFKGKSRSRNTRYIVYRWGQRQIFVKYAQRLRINPGVERFVGALNSPSFAAPAFLGSGHVDGQHFAIWERQPYPHFEDFTRSTVEELYKIVDASVVISSSTELLLSEAPDVLKTTLWMTPLARKLDDGLSVLSQQGTDVADLKAGTKLFNQLERDVIDRFAHLGNPYFTHNDIAFHNILRTPEGRVILVDWELATISAPGASLRGLATLDEDAQRKFAKRYAQGMRDSGFAVGADDAFFVMGAMHVYFGLSMALAAKSAGQIKQALAAVEGHIQQRL